MNAMAELVWAQAGSHPSGTGSYTYGSGFRVVVQNLAYDKLVGIWGRESGSNTWIFHPCDYQGSVPGNLEVWGANVQVSQIDRFDVEYQVLGQIYWDNNSGYDYILDVPAAESVDGIGTVVIGPKVTVGGQYMEPNSGTLSVQILVQNLAYQKQVAIVYTTNN
jgi:hypothetical protein